MALSANTPVKLCEGMWDNHPVLASATIYEGSMVGSSSGYARALSAGDVFLGHARNYVVDTAGVSGTKRVDVFSGEYDLEVALSGAAITDIGKEIYASDDATYTLTQGSNSRVGFVKKYVSSGLILVTHRPFGVEATNHQHTSATGVADGGPLTSPHIVTAIEDTNGNELFKLTATTNAVNEFTVANATTANAVTLSATGPSAAAGIAITPKGVGRVTVTNLTASSPALTSPRITTDVSDSAGNELFTVTATGSAVNSFNIANATTANAVTLSAVGPSAAAGIAITPKGTGRVTVTQLSATSPRFTTDISDSGGNELLKFTATGSAVNELTLANAATAGTVSLAVTGSTTNCSVSLSPKGTGAVVLGTTSTMKVSLYGVSGAARANHVANPTTLTTALTAVASILTALENLGALKTS